MESFSILVKCKKIIRAWGIVLPGWMRKIMMGLRPWQRNLKDLCLDNLVSCLSDSHVKQYI